MRQVTYQEFKKLAYSYQLYLTLTNSNNPTYSLTQCASLLIFNYAHRSHLGSNPSLLKRTNKHHQNHLQKSRYSPGTSASEKIMDIVREMTRMEGAKAFYKGITPRVLRVAPGQAIVFPVYEEVIQDIETMQGSDYSGDTYSEY